MVDGVAGLWWVLLCRPAPSADWVPSSKEVEDEHWMPVT